MILSEALVKEGVVTLRYDKRGTGRSQLPAGTPLRFEDIVADAGAAVSFLAERSEVDPKRLAVIGHEEGAWPPCSSRPASRASVAWL